MEVSGKNWNDFLKNAGRGLVECLAPRPQGERKPKKIKIKLAAPDPESLLIAWLNEIAYLLQTKNFLPTKWNIKYGADGGWAEITGRTYKRLALGREVKSATFHNLKIRQTKSKIGTTVILDV